MSKSIKEVKNDLYELPRNARTQVVMEELVNLVNAMGKEEEVGEIMAIVLQNSHRTLQQSFFTALNAMFKEYQNTATDLRNEAAVDYAKKIVAMEHYFPFV